MSLIGKCGDTEIDFIGEKQEKRIYIQVTFRMESNELVEREFAPLLKIRDNYPKYVVSLNQLWKDMPLGIIHRYFPDFLLEDW